jgi:hypothetical protein
VAEHARRPADARPVLPLLARRRALPGRVVDDVPGVRAETRPAGTVAGRWPTLLADDPQWTIAAPAEPEDVLGAEQRGTPWTG